MIKDNVAEGIASASKTEPATVPTGLSREELEEVAVALRTEAKEDAVFHACNANRSGDLDLSESRFALQAFGLYPKDRDIEERSRSWVCNYL